MHGTRESCEIMNSRGRPRKVTQEQLEAIFHLANCGKNYLEIAKELGINKGSVAWFMKKQAGRNSVNRQDGQL